MCRACVYPPTLAHTLACLAWALCLDAFQVKELERDNTDLSVCVTFPEEGAIRVENDRGKEKAWEFDQTFDFRASQKQIYDEVAMDQPNGPMERWLSASFREGCSSQPTNPTNQPTNQPTSQPTNRPAFFTNSQTGQLTDQPTDRHTLKCAIV